MQRGETNYGQGRKTYELIDSQSLSQTDVAKEWLHGQYCAKKMNR